VVCRWLARADDVHIPFNVATCNRKVAVCTLDSTACKASAVLDSDVGRCTAQHACCSGLCNTRLVMTLMRPASLGMLYSLTQAKDFLQVTWRPTQHTVAVLTPRELCTGYCAVQQLLPLQRQ
jgi:hypothetical protein